MPRQVDQLDLENRANLTNAFQVLVTNPANYELFRVPVLNFRGASVFFSSNAPTTTPENSDIGEYIDGDIFVEDSDQGQIVYSWDAGDGSWSNPKKLNGSRLLNSGDFPDEVNLDLREENFITNIAYTGDFYLNRTLNLLFGSYEGTQGFKFGTTDFSGYQGFRPPTTFTVQGQDALGYDNPSVYLDVILNNGALSAAQRLAAKLPIHRDGLHIQLEDDEGHGGWWYYFNDQIDATGASLQENYNLKMGTNTAGDQSDVKIHFRDPKVWYEREEPVQNDKKYREGDNVFDILTGTLYYNYIEGFVPALDGDDNPLPVTIDDIFEGSTKLNALRSTTTVFAETTNVDFEPPTVNGHSSWGGGTLIRGDIIEVSLTGSATDKRWNWTVASVVDDLDLNGDPIGTQTLTWENKRSYYGSRSFTVTDFNINPLTNADFKTLYVTGDFVVDANQRKYEFDEDTFTLTFVGFDREPTVFTETKNSMWTPTVTNGFVLNWNSQPDTTFMVGDVLRVQAEGSTTNKVFEYLVTGQQPVVLSARTNPNPTRVHTYNGGVSGSPPRNDADYSAGDFIDNLTDGYRYGGYVENQLTDATSWPQFIKVSSSGIIITDDANPDVTYKLGMSNFNPYFEVLTVTVPDPTE